MYENGKIYMGLADGARVELALNMCCLLYTSDAADE